MVPNAEQVIVFRWKIAVYMRLFGVVCFLFSVPWLLIWLVEAIHRDELLNFSYYGELIVTGGLSIIAGVVFLTCAGAFSRVLVPLPRTLLCPDCCYELAGIATAQCPECGLVLPEAYVTLASATNPSHNRLNKPKPLWQVIDALSFPALLCIAAVAGIIYLVFIITAISDDSFVISMSFTTLATMPAVIASLLGMRALWRLQTTAPAQQSSADTAPNDNARE
ncbi:MAG: hypothetical protein H6815_07050 [Phycisphaeraceae bacterium]|nr:hypothetical protein [Phycisphaerales bacterium]MCB9860197.1 hypothetical protein [Phycisphaeraceae bacterium]